MGEALLGAAVAICFTLLIVACTNHSADIVRANATLEHNAQMGQCIRLNGETLQSYQRCIELLDPNLHAAIRDSGHFQRGN